MKKLVLYILISATLFSTMEVVLKVAGNQLDAFQLTFIRFLIGGTFLLPFAFIEIKKYHTVIAKKDFLHMIAMGVVCICVSMVFFQLGVENSKASTAAVIFCINPMFTMFFAHFMTEEKLNRTKVVALTIGLLGIVFMINPLHTEAGNTFLGFAYTIIAALTFGLYSAMGRTSIKRLRGITQTSISFLSGSVVMIPILLVMNRPIIEGVNADNIWMVLYIGIMITGLGYLFYFLAMEVSDAATASIVFFVKPALAPIIAVIALGEVVGINGLIGILLIFIGSYINLREQKKRKKEATMKKITIEDFENTFRDREPKSLGSYQYYSVLVPLVEKDGELHILYEVRAENLKRQPGEVCFPGGRVENDESAEECAVRETSEELNIKPEEIRIIAQMDFMHTYSNFTLYSLLGIIDYEEVSRVEVNPDEVKEIFLVPVSFFAENEPEIYCFDVLPNIGPDFPYEKINSTNGYNWRKGKSTVPIYRYGDRVIWGLTARITSHLMDLVTGKI